MTPKSNNNIMDNQTLEDLLRSIQENRLSVDEAMKTLKHFSYQDIGHTKIDNHRQIRTGYPEVIYCSGKTPEQVRDIFQAMLERDNNVIATRAGKHIYKEVASVIPEVEYHETARIITLQRKEIPMVQTNISVVTAGTSDMPVAEEAAVTAGFFGNPVKRFYDVGVAGIHRLQKNIADIADARVVVVIAGMEGALPSVVGGLVDKPVIAVPTSIGYGASFQGLSALLGMLTSCASGVSVVNIDNGFGAGYMASMINKLR
ncbi:MAG: nickel pincer cofactor biosynthesis protein LarB [Bacteroidales bacterium]|nr:nickel pincer cofactor biosynthesis protein LarB [Bacteroidales bacterium]